jgi:hypothetical protein
VETNRLLNLNLYSDTRVGGGDKSYSWGDRLSSPIRRQELLRAIDQFFRHLYPIPSFAFLHEPSVRQIGHWLTFEVETNRLLNLNLYSDTRVGGGDKSYSRQELLRAIDQFFRHLYPIPSFAFLHEPSVRQHCLDGSLDQSLALSLAARRCGYNNEL